MSRVGGAGSLPAASLPHEAQTDERDGGEEAQELEGRARLALVKLAGAGAHDDEGPGLAQPRGRCLHVGSVDLINRTRTVQRLLTMPPAR